jgi:hypothetical protein
MSAHGNERPHPYKRQGTRRLRQEPEAWPVPATDHNGVVSNPCASWLDEQRGQHRRDGATAFRCLLLSFRANEQGVRRTTVNEIWVFEAKDERQRTIMVPLRGTDRTVSVSASGRERRATVQGSVVREPVAVGKQRVGRIVGDVGLLAANGFHRRGQLEGQRTRGGAPAEDQVEDGSVIGAEVGK